MDSRELIQLKSRVAHSFPELIKSWRTLSIISREDAAIYSTSMSMDTFDNVNDAYMSLESNETEPSYILPSRFSPLTKYDDAIKIIRLLKEKGHITTLVVNNEDSVFISFDDLDAKNGKLEDLPKLICLAALEVKRI